MLICRRRVRVVGRFRLARERILFRRPTLSETVHILAVGIDSGDRERLARSLAGLGRVRTAGSCSQAMRIARSTRLDLAVLEATYGQGVGHAETVRRLRRLHPVLPMVLHCRMHPKVLPEVVALCREGVSDLAVAGVTDLRSVVTLVFDRSRDPSVPAELIRAFLDLASPDVQKLILACFELIESETTVEALASRLGVTRRTLTN